MTSTRVEVLDRRPRFERLDVLFVRDDVVVTTTGAWAAVDGAAVDRERPATVVTYVLAREADGWQFTPVAPAA